MHVASGGLTDRSLTRVREARPDVLLLVGGTDGGNAEVLLEAAHELADARWSGPVVVAGNVDAQAGVARLLRAADTPHVLADNVASADRGAGPRLRRGPRSARCSCVT